MSVSDIQQQLNSNLQNGQFNLDSSSSETHITGKFMVGSAQFDITGDLDSKTNLWAITTDATTAPPASLPDLSGVIGITDVSNQLPIGVAVFTNTQLLAMTFSIGATNTLPASMTLIVNPTGSANWDIVPGILTLSNIQLSISTSRSPLSKTPSSSTFYGSISGVITIRQQPFYVELDLSPRNLWILKVGTADHPALPALSDLAGLLGQGDPTSFLNETMCALQIDAELGSVAILFVEIAFDRFTNSLMYVRLGFQAQFRGIAVDVTIRLPNFSIQIALNTSNKPSVLAFLQTFIHNMPDPDGALSQTHIAELAVSATPQDQTYALNVQLDSTWEISIPVASTITFSIRSLTLDLEAVQNNVGFVFSGTLELFQNIILSISAERAIGAGWTFSGSLSTATPVNLTDIVSSYVNPTLGSGQSIDLSGNNLSTLQIEQLGITIQLSGDTNPTQKTYTFVGAASWKVPIGSDAVFEIDAAVSITKPSGQPASGFIQGSLFVNDFFFQNLQVLVRYDFTPTSKDLIFTLVKDTQELDATLTWGTNQDTILTVQFKDISVGDVLTFLVNLVDPYLDFKLDSPWDALNNFSLDSFALTVNITQKTVGILYTSPINLGFITITAMEFTYEKVNGEGTVTISLGGSFFGQTYDPLKNPLKWDALNGAPPTVPGKGNGVFDLDYLGLGQHVALQNVTDLDTVEQVILALQNTVVPIQSTSQNPIKQLPGLVFNADSGWLIGAQFTVINTVAISLVFNDPEVYGLLIALSGDKARIFAGLKFEILYHKVSDTVGVYHIELKLPDEMRHLEFGELSITLPVIILDIYTNGDFRINVGYPTNGDFSVSFAVEFFPFVGYGGFYFAKLSSQTATNIPQITNGTFNPVIEFGVGLSIGVGKSIDEGIFTAGLTVTVEGFFEGIFAWFRPTDTTQPDAEYYKITATLAIVGHLYGSINFAIIQASIDIMVYVAVTGVLEAYQPFLIDLVAGVSVKVSVKILFIRIHLSFSTTIRAHFTLGSASPTPWQIASGAPPQLAAMAAPIRAAEVNSLGERMGMLDLVGVPPTQNPALNWGAFPIWAQPRKLDLLFEPNFTILTPPGSDAASRVAGIALLFLENDLPPTDPDDFQSLFVASDHAPEQPFNILVEGILAWAILAYLNRGGNSVPPQETNTCQDAVTGAVDYSDAVNQAQISLDDLNDLYSILVDQDSTGKLPFSTPDDVPNFLQQNLCFNLTTTTADVSGTYFPIFPELIMTVGSTTVDFSANPIDDSYLAAVETFVQTLQVQFQNAEESSQDSSGASQAFADALGSLSMAGFIFQDYFAIIARSAVQAAIDYVQTLSGTTCQVSNLLTYMRGADAVNTIAGMVSRFLLYGLRLPTPNDEATLQALFVLTGQQFDVPTPLPSALSITLAPSAPVNWLQFPSSSQLTYDVIPGDWADILGQLASATFSPVINSAQALQNYQLDTMRYTFQHQLHWNTASTLNLCSGPASTGALTLWSFPSTLADTLETATNFPLDVTLWEATPATSGNTGLNKNPATCFAWATLVSFGLTQVPAANGSGTLPNTYQLIGTTEDGRLLLEALWPYLETLDPSITANLFILYPQGNTSGSDPGLMNDAPINPFLLKVNLSTQSNPQASNLLDAAETADDTPPVMIYDASLSQATNFIRLVWETSVTNTGGYYLHYTTSGGGDLPASLFANGPTADLYLLIVLESTSTNLQGQLQPFHNVVVLADTLTDGETLFATANQILVKQATIPPGTVGFQIDRTPQAETVLQGRLDELYNLVGYTITQNSFFKASIEGLPAGPQFDQNDNNQAVGTDWLYKRIVPFYPSAINNSLSGVTNPVLPPAAQNPYAGLSAAAQLELAFTYQDAFGNQISGAPSLPNLSIPVAYTDSVLGVSFWASVAAGYTFTANDANTANLNILLHFDSSKYMPSSSLSFASAFNKIRSDRFTYQQIYYQIHQADVTFSLTTTLNNAQVFALDPTLFSGLTDRIYIYLATLANFVNALTYLVPAGSTSTSLETIGTAYGVSPDDLATQNATIINIYSAGTPLQIPLFYRVPSGQTLEVIAQQSGISLLTLATQAADDPAFLQAGTVLATGQTIPFTVNGAVSLTQIAQQFANVSPGAVASANPTASLGAAKVNIRNTPTDATGQTLNGLVDSYNRQSSSQPPLTAAEIGSTNAGIFGLFPDKMPLNIPVNHEVLAGETLTIVAQIYNLTIAALLQQNPNDADLLNANARMLITQQSYTTADGDTLTTIAQKANIIITQHNQSAVANEQLPYELLSSADIGHANATAALNAAMGLDTNDPNQTVPAPLTIPGWVGLTVTGDSSNYALHQVNGSIDTLASLAGANQNPSDLAVANADVSGLLNPGGKFTYSGVTLAVGANDSFSTMQTRFNASYAVTSDTLTTLSNQNVPSELVQKLQTMVGQSYENTTGLLTAVQQVFGAQDTARYQVALTKAASIGITAPATVALLGTSNATINGLLKDTSLMLLPPSPLAATLQIALHTNALPSDPIFPLVVQLMMNRSARLIDPNFADTPAVQTNATSLSPVTTDGAAADTANLQQFASNFEAAFLNQLKLATGNRNQQKTQNCPPPTETTATEVDDSASTRALWVVNLSSGLTYSLNTAQPLFFIPTLLANVLLDSDGAVQLDAYVSGTGLQPNAGAAQVFQGVDLDGWGSAFLQAVDNFLDPTFVIPATQIDPPTLQSVEALLTAKQALADAIAAQVVPVFDYSSATTFGTVTAALGLPLSILAAQYSQNQGFFNQTTITVGQAHYNATPLDSINTVAQGLSLQPAAVVDALKDDDQAVNAATVLSTLLADVITPAAQMLEQRLMISLAEAYTVDAIVQYNVSVTSPCPDPKTAPNLFGKPVASSYTLPPQATLTTIGAAFSVPMSASHVATVLASTSNLLVAGVVLTSGTNKYTIGAQDTLVSVCAGLKLTTLDSLVTLLQQSNAFIFKAGAVIPLAQFTFTVPTGGALIDIAQYFEFTPYDVVSANQDIPGLLVAGVTITVGSSSYTVKSNDTFAKAAAALNATLQDFSTALVQQSRNTNPIAGGSTFGVLKLQTSYNLSTAKLPLNNGQSYLPFVFSTKDQGIASRVFLDLSYRITALEFDIEYLQDIEGYRASGWLSFVIPIDGTAFNGRNLIGQTAVPVPIRAYPTPPGLVAQQMQTQAAQQLADVRDRTYQYTYEHPNAVQDTIHTLVQYNVPLNAPPTLPFAAQDERNLFEALANFTTLYPAIQSDLLQLPLLASGGNRPTAKQAVLAFQALVTEIASAWGSWQEVFVPVATGAAQYEISEIFDADTLSVTVTDLSTSDSPDFPDIEVPGYVPLKEEVLGSLALLRAQSAFNQESKTYQFQPAPPPATAPSIPQVSISFVDLDILAQQNAWGELWLLRNANLSPLQATNPRLIYQTTPIKFKNPLIPLVDNEDTWQVGSLTLQGNQSQEVSDLTAILQNSIFDILLPAGTQPSYTVKLVVSYNFTLQDTLTASLPILLMPHGVYTPQATAAADEPVVLSLSDLAQVLINWFYATNPAANGAFFRLSLALFPQLSGVTVSTPPIMQVNDLRIGLTLGE